MKKKIKITVISIICVIAVIITGTITYATKSTYKADVDLFSDGSNSYSIDGVTVNKVSSNRIEFVPDDVKAGLIFYPGGSVEYTAYAPLLEALSQKGILCVLVKMPLNLAVLSPNAAKGINENYPDVDNWYIGGHSLGGAMAGSYISKSPDNIKGLILLAAYSASDLSDTGKQVISVYGTNDGVLNMEKYKEYRTNLPDEIDELVIDGGCHSYFGAYGNQKGDGTPTITREEQMEKSADFIANAMGIE